MVGRSACSAPTWALRMRCHCHPMQVAGNSGCSETGVHPPVATVAFAGTKVLLYVGCKPHNKLADHPAAIPSPSYPLPCRTAYAEIPEGACRHRRGLGAISERGGREESLHVGPKRRDPGRFCTVIRTVAMSDCDRSLLRIVDGRPDWPRRGDCGDLRLAWCGEFGWAVRDQTMQVFSMPSGGNTPAAGGCDLAASVSFLLGWV